MIKIKKRPGELTVAEALDELGVCRNTLYAFEKRGQLIAKRNYIGHRLFAKSDVLRMKRRLDARFEK